MLRIVLTFGLIAGAILSLAMAATVPFMDEIGFDRGAVIGYTSMVAAFLLIFFGVRAYRDNVAGGTVSFGRAFKVGALIGLVASLCYVVTWEVIYYNFIPDFLERYQAHAIEKARAGGATAVELEEQQAQMQRYAQWYRNPLVNAAMTLVEPMPVALLIAAISAAVLSRRRRAPDAVTA